MRHRSFTCSGRVPLELSLTPGFLVYGQPEGEIGLSCRESGLVQLFAGPQQRSVDRRGQRRAGHMLSSNDTFLSKQEAIEVNWSAANFPGPDTELFAACKVFVEFAQGPTCDRSPSDGNIAG